MEKDEQQLEGAEPTQNPEAEAEGKPTEDVEKIKAELAKYKAIADRKTKKLEELKSSLEEKKETKETKKEPNLTRDEAIFLAKGGTEDELEVLNRIRGERTLKDAAKDEIFVAWREKRQQEDEAKQAQLRPSGSGSSAAKKSYGDMSPEEHRKAYLDAIEEVTSQMSS
jgi:hypothetical protein